MSSKANHFFCLSIVLSLLPLLGQSQPISVGSGATALTCDGKVYMAGSNEYGMLGMGLTAQDVNYFTQVPGLDSIVGVSTHGAFVLALNEKGRLYYWGLNASGAFGGRKSFYYRPEMRKNLDSLTAVAAGNEHILVLRADSTVWGFGGNLYGELGPVPPYNLDTARPFLSLPPIVDIAAGNHFSLALDHQGRMWAWGWNNFGQLGQGNRDTSHQPLMITAPTNIQHLNAYRYTNGIAVDSNGGVWTWGENRQGELGIPRDSQGPWTTTPTQVPNVQNAVSAVQGYRFSLALLKSGKIMAWGKYYGLGTGNRQNRFTPGYVPGLDSISYIEASDWTAFAIDSAGNVYSWGINPFGQLATGTDTFYLTPTEVPLNCSPYIANRSYTFSNTHQGEDPPQIYPNPATRVLAIQYPEGLFIQKVQLLTITGNLLQQWQGNPELISLRPFSNGLYLLQFTSKKGRVYTQKLRIE